ncbi:MAG: histidine phosphatase family protein [Piscinibacter sp.]
MLQRRAFIAATLAGSGLAARGAEDAEAWLRRGGVVVAFRHALAPGTFDPPGFRLGDCSTQRNLNDEGRAQASQLGSWFAARSLKPARVLSSPWCRCIDTAALAFGTHEIEPALGSPRGASETTNEASLRRLRGGLAAARSGQFEVWITHMFVLSALVGEGTASGEGLVLRASTSGAPELLARLRLS